jgi:hypothetical protein
VIGIDSELRPRGHSFLGRRRDVHVFVIAVTADGDDSRRFGRYSGERRHRWRIESCLMILGHWEEIGIMVVVFIVHIGYLLRVLNSSDGDGSHIWE